jgi:hypothetical protein
MEVDDAEVEWLEPKCIHNVSFCFDFPFSFVPFNHQHPEQSVKRSDAFLLVICKLQVSLELTKEKKFKF